MIERLSLLLTKPSYFQRMSQNVTELVRLFSMSKEKMEPGI